MAAPRACDSCGDDSAFERRRRCVRCAGQVHADCRDIARVCYGCRWRQARTGGIDVDMLAPGQAGRDPWAKNLPATVTQGLPLPPLHDEEHQGGVSANELRILTEALWSGWHIESRSSLGYGFVLNKRGRGHLEIAFTVTGRVLWAHSQYRNIERTPDTTRILAYLESK